LPSVTYARLTRPAIGETTRVNSRLSSTARSAASTAATWAVASCANFERHRVLGAQTLGALQFRGGALHGRARSHQLGAQTIDFGEERTVIDLKQRVALADDGAFLEAYGRDVAGDTGTDVDRLDGLEAAGELIPLGDLAIDHRGNRDLRRPLRGRLRRGPGATRRDDSNEGNERQRQPQAEPDVRHPAKTMC
jgi:hypothetical protein